MVEYPTFIIEKKSNAELPATVREGVNKLLKEIKKTFEATKEPRGFIYRQKIKTLGEIEATLAGICAPNNLLKELGSAKVMIPYSTRENSGLAYAAFIGLAQNGAIPWIDQQEMNIHVKPNEQKEEQESENIERERGIGFGQEFSSAIEIGIPNDSYGLISMSEGVLENPKWVLGTEVHTLLKKGNKVHVMWPEINGDPNYLQNKIKEKLEDRDYFQQHASEISSANLIREGFEKLLNPEIVNNIFVKEEYKNDTHAFGDFLIRHFIAAENRSYEAIEFKPSFNISSEEVAQDKIHPKDVILDISRLKEAIKASIDADNKTLLEVRVQLLEEIETILATIINPNFIAQHLYKIAGEKGKKIFLPNIKEGYAPYMNEIRKSLEDLGFAVIGTKSESIFTLLPLESSVIQKITNPYHVSTYYGSQLLEKDPSTILPIWLDNDVGISVENISGIKDNYRGGNDAQVLKSLIGVHALIVEKEVDLNENKPNNIKETIIYLLTRALLVEMAKKRSK